MKYDCGCSFTKNICYQNDPQRIIKIEKYNIIVKAFIHKTQFTTRTVNNIHYD